MEIELPRIFRLDRMSLPVRIGIILAILACDVLLGMRASTRLLIPVVGLVAAGVGFVLFFRRMEWGLLLLLPASFFGRWNISTGTNVAFNFTIVLLIFLVGIWLLKMVLFERRVTLESSPLNAPALLLLIVMTLALVAGNVRWIPQASATASFFAQLGGWLLYALSIATLLLPGNLMKDVRLIWFVVWEFLILGFIFIYTHLIPFTARFINSIFVHGSYLGSTFWIWTAAFATSYLVVGEKSQTRRAIFLALLLAAMFYDRWFLYREWISGWGPPLIAVGVILWLRNWRLALFTTLIGGVVVGVSFSLLSSAVMTETQQYSLYSRTATWPIMFELLKSSPILGLGPSNYYYYTPLFSLLGWHVSFNSHNNYWDIVAQYGFVGLLAFLWLIFEIFRLAWRVRARAQDEFSRVYAYACLGGLVGMLASGMLGDWFMPFLYNVSTGGFRFSVVNWLFLGGLAVIDYAIRQNEVPE
jgi:O-antigen ligase